MGARRGRSATRSAGSSARLPGSTVMHQNVAIAEAIALSCFRPVDPGAEPRRLRARRTSRPSATCTRRSPTSRSWCARTTRRSWSGSTSARSSSRSATSSSRTREIQDVEPIVRRAHEVGAHVILDCYQSAGIVPLDVTALGVDFAVGGSVKWLCGGPGERLALRAARPRRAARADVHGLAGARAAVRVRGGDGVRGRRRALPHGHAESGGALAGTAGYDLIEEIGVARIRENSLARPQLLIDLADARGFEVAARARPDAARRRRDRRASRRPRRSTRSSRTRAILCDFRPGAGIRLGPHFFSTDDELRFAIAQIAEILETGACQRHPGAVALH